MLNEICFKASACLSGMFSLSLSWMQQKHNPNIYFSAVLQNVKGQEMASVWSFGAAVGDIICETLKRSKIIAADQNEPGGASFLKIHPLNILPRNTENDLTDLARVH